MVHIDRNHGLGIFRGSRVCTLACDQERVTSNHHRQVAGIPVSVIKEQVFIGFKTKQGGSKKLPGIRFFDEKDRVAGLNISKLQREGLCVHDAVTQISMIIGNYTSLLMSGSAYDLVTTHGLSSF